MSTGAATGPENEVVAAGTVPRRTRSSRLEVLLVHRPKYDDWSFPKGKLDPGEHVTAAAVRETREECGLVVGLDVPLPEQHYLASGRPKRVHYWSATVLSGRFQPNSEVDRVAWLSLPAARKRLSWPRDEALLDALEGSAPATAPLLLLEPGPGVDDSGSLDPLGHAQARALLPLLTAYAPARLVSSDEVRALETVTPLADATGLVVEVNPLLGLDGWTAAGQPVRTQLVEHLLEPVRTVACGSARAELLAHLDGFPDATDRGAAAPPIRVLHLSGGRVVAGETHSLEDAPA